MIIRDLKSWSKSTQIRNFIKETLHSYNALRSPARHYGAGQYCRSFVQQAWRTTMESKFCAECGRRFNPRVQTPHQTYCSNPACQRARKRKWQQDKLRNDPDYAHNQARAQHAWCSRNPDYWQHYRGAHPDYVEQNRRTQRERHPRSTGRAVAKMDASNSEEPVLTPPSGIYNMNLIAGSGVAKMDVWTVELRVISRVRHGSVHVAKR
jgi:hypothetical protein